MTTDAVLLTCGSKGMKLITDDSRDIKTVAKSVYDVTGAGDTVIATYTYFRLLGYSRYESANLANIAAGIVVSKAGTSFIHLEDLNEYINPFNNVKMVDKVWGNEVWFANSNLYCGKILNLKQGYQCSIHHHKEKDETFYVLDGKVRMVINDEERIMEKGDTVKLKPNDWHTFGGILPSVILEVSTQHFDNDSYRKNESGKWDEYENYIH
jgi:mannose-6-phosphate isomerase-like protein (cupin superfamily)